jgi:hypothetical protein
MRRCFADTMLPLFFIYASPQLFAFFIEQPHAFHFFADIYFLFFHAD